MDTGWIQDGFRIHLIFLWNTYYFHNLSMFFCIFIFPKKTGLLILLSIFYEKGLNRQFCYGLVLTMYVHNKKIISVKIKHKTNNSKMFYETFVYFIILTHFIVDFIMNVL